MKSAVIVHGKPPRERYENPEEPKPHEANWLPWLGRQLSDRGVEVSIPVLPVPYFPVFRDWESVFQKNSISQETGLVGHSAGAEFILRWFSENKEAKAERIVLVAPYCDYERKYGDYSQYIIDIGLIERVGRLTIFSSSDDHEPILRRARELATLFPEADSVKLQGFGHFMIGHNMQSEEFPLLLDHMS
jgi:predicted alpha/beta hydrolase family esterase